MWPCPLWFERLWVVSLFGASTDLHIAVLVCMWPGLCLNEISLDQFMNSRTSAALAFRYLGEARQNAHPLLGNVRTILRSISKDRALHSFRFECTRTCAPPPAPLESRPVDTRTSTAEASSTYTLTPDPSSLALHALPAALKRLWLVPPPKTDTLVSRQGPRRPTGWLVWSRVEWLYAQREREWSIIAWPVMIKGWPVMITGWLVDW
jgi:hypothetical protein